MEYAPNDTLGDKLAHFFGSEPYILQMCRNELVLIPMHMNVSVDYICFLPTQRQKIPPQALCLRRRRILHAVTVYRLPGRNELVLIPMHMNVSCGTVAYYSLENKVALQLSCVMSMASCAALRGSPDLS